MDTGDVPESATRKHGLESTELPVPAMPNIRPHERWAAFPFQLVEDLPVTIGWHFPAARNGEPAFVTMTCSELGRLTGAERFPLTQDGWAKAWEALAAASPDSAETCRARLRDRGPGQQELNLQPERRSLACLRQVALLGGYAPEAAIAIGERYDARFLYDRLALYAADYQEPLTEVPYTEIEEVEIGGPGLVKSGGGFIGGGFGAVGALEGMAIASVLNALTTRTSVTTIIRVQAKSCELFLLWTKSTPEQLRMELSRALGAIRAAKATRETKASASPVGELAKLAEMLQAGLITREEFDQFKAKLLQA